MICKICSCSPTPPTTENTMLSLKLQTFWFTLRIYKIVQIILILILGKKKVQIEYGRVFFLSYYHFVNILLTNVYLVYMFLVLPFVCYVILFSFYSFFLFVGYTTLGMNTNLSAIVLSL